AGPLQGVRGQARRGGAGYDVDVAEYEGVFVQPVAPRAVPWAGELRPFRPKDQAPKGRQEYSPGHRPGCGGTQPMDQVFEGAPRGVLMLDERKVPRAEVRNDWGTRLQWKVSRNGKVVAVVPARADTTYEHPDAVPGVYEIVLELWKYEGYKNKDHGLFVEISNKVHYII